MTLFTVAVIFWHLFFAIVTMVILAEKIAENEEDSGTVDLIFINSIVAVIFFCLFFVPAHLLQAFWAGRVRKRDQKNGYGAGYYRGMEGGVSQGDPAFPQPLRIKNMVYTAQHYERAGRFEEAARIYEECGLWEDAERVRLRMNELQVSKSSFRAHSIQRDSSVSIRDSVVVGSDIRAGSSRGWLPQDQGTGIPGSPGDESYPETVSHCSSCGWQGPWNSRFCRVCGASIVGESPIQGPVDRDEQAHQSMEP